ncbi:unnamed protein product [Pylaiella littoralis]
MASVQDVVRVLAHNPAHERVNDNSSNGSAKPVVAASMFEFSFSKLSRRLLGIAGVMACVVVLVTSSRWSEMHQPARLANGFTKGDSSPFGIRGGGDGGAAAESTLVHDEEFITSAVAKEIGPSVNRARGNTRTLSVDLELGAAATPAKSTALLVAVGVGSEGKAALQVWSDFTSFAQMPVTAANMMNQGKFDRDCGGGRGGGVVSGPGWGPGGHANAQDQDGSQLMFPPVWILTSDSEIDKTIRESMPHLQPFYVPGALGYDASGDGYPKRQESISWSDVLDRFLSENPGVDVFGIYGEGAMPPAALLPYLLPSDSATFDATSAAAVATAGCSSSGSSSAGGCAIESVLWPILSKSILPTAVVSRARAWWIDDKVTEGAEEEPCASRGRVGEWLPDKFVAQVWCNRAMLTTTRRKATCLGEPGCIGGQGLDTFLHVIQRLLREPGAVDAVLIDGTKAVPSRFLYPPAVAQNDRFGVRKIQNDLEADHVLLRQLVHERRRKEMERQQKQREDPAAAATPTLSTLTTTKPKSFPEVEFYIGTLGFALGHGGATHVADSPEDASASKETISNIRGSNGSAEVDGNSWHIAKAPWPPEYILETVVQSQFTSDGFGVDGGDTGSTRREGLVIVSSVNCGYLDFAANFLLSLRRSALNIKVLFVATDDVSFDFLDAMSPGHTALFTPTGWSHHAAGAGDFGDAVFKKHTYTRPTILISILGQGYRTLWIDSDTAWLGSVFPVLPDPRDISHPVAEVVLVDDVYSGLCTCFMYLDCTPSVMRLMQLWKQNIIATDPGQDQVCTIRQRLEKKRTSLPPSCHLSVSDIFNTASSVFWLFLSVSSVVIAGTAFEVAFTFKGGYFEPRAREAGNKMSSSTPKTCFTLPQNKKTPCVSSSLESGGAQEFGRNGLRTTKLWFLVYSLFWIS